MVYEKVNTLPLRSDLKEYLYGRLETGVLLIGQKGMNMMKDAETLASFILSVENLSSSPDYLFVGLPEGASSIGVSEAEQILSRSQFRPASAERIVIVIDEMDKMTVPAQNKLLKLLEDSETVLVIGIAYEDTLLPTVKSRMQVFNYAPLDMESFRAYCVEHQIAEPEIQYFISGGMTDSINVSNPVIPIFAGVKNVIKEKKGYGALLSVLNLVKEKDKESFFSAYPKYISSLISFMGQMFTEGLVNEPSSFELITLCAEHRERCNAVSYTKDDFFSFIAQIIWKGENSI